MEKIVVIGSLNLDYVVNVQRMPAVGETILAEDFSRIPGGKGANQAFALARMGADVTMLGAVGKDPNGELEIENLRKAGVDVNQIALVEEATGMAWISVDSCGNNSITVVQGANRLVSADYLDRHMDTLQNADIVVLQLEIPLSTVIYAAAAAKALGKLVILDPAPVSEPLPEDLLRHVDIMKPNELELETLTGMRDAKKRLPLACEKLLAQGVGCVLASLGSEGVYVAAKGTTFRQYPCEKVPVVDTTAAGDSFTAATAFALAKGKNVFEAAQFANKVASVVVTRKGAQSSIPTKEEIDNLWNT